MTKSSIQYGEEFESEERPQLIMRVPGGYIYIDKRNNESAPDNEVFDDLVKTIKYKIV